VKTLLLLAGQSKRFWPLREKALFPICGRTLLEHQLERLQEAGLTDITLVGGAHNLAAIRERFPKLSAIEQERLDLGMRGALLSALPQCDNEPIMVVSGNDIIEPAAYKLLLAAAKKGDGALLAQRVKRYFPGGYLTVDGDRITGIVEKPGEGNEPSDLVNIVAHIHGSPGELLKALQHVDESQDDGYEQALAKLFAERSYRAVPYEGVWQAVKYPWHILPLLELLLAEINKSDIHPSAEVHKTAVISGNVVIGEGSRVLPHATIVGPCYIGKRCIIANNALARGCSIGDDCIVGFCTEVKASVWHSHVWTHMTYSGDSVIGHNVSFGAGAVTGNFRLDEREIESASGEEKIGTNLTKLGAIIGDNCRLGIHVTLDPGVKVGAGSFIASAVHLSSDVPDGQFARMKDGILKVVENNESVPAPGERERYRKRL
jgi:bifunctional UDP-N-acetylglucosamine pyrophosphorylase/glucosamine-1-phosphate N-acetyltransferase